MTTSNRTSGPLESRRFEEADISAEFEQALPYVLNRLRRDFADRLSAGGDPAGALLSHLRFRPAPPLLFSPGRLGEIAALAARLDPSEQAWNARIADEALAGRVYAASNAYCDRFVELPEDFDFSRYDHYDREAIHGLGRQRWLTALVKRYWLDGDERYFRSLLGHWDYYARRVPPVTEELLAGIHAIGPIGLTPPYGELDCFIRLTNWWWAFWMSIPAAPMTPQRACVLLARCLRLFDLVAARGIKQHEHNFTSMQMEALYLWATSLPEVQGMDVWRHAARNIAESSLKRAVFDDGVQWEKSAGYHAGCIRWYGLSFLLGQRTGQPWAAAYAERLRAMGEFLDAIVTPDGHIPLLSDSDRQGVWRGAMALLLCIFPDMKLRQPVGPTDSSLWASDGRVWDPADVVAEKPAVAVFPVGGLAAIRHRDPAAGTLLLVDNGPTKAGHAHKNNLTVHFDALMKPVVVDPGRWIYTLDHDRHWVKQCQSHNTVWIGDRPLDPSVEDTPEIVQLIPSTDDARVDPVAARVEGDLAIVNTGFGGYVDEPGARVRRTAVTPLAGEPWLAVVDEIDSPAEHCWTNSWLLPAKRAIQADGSGWRVVLDSGLHLAMSLWAGGELSLSDVERFWCPQYAEKEPARWLRFSARCSRQVRAFIFVPSQAQPEMPSISVSGAVATCRAGGREWTFPVPSMQRPPSA